MKKPCNKLGNILYEKERQIKKIREQYKQKIARAKGKEAKTKLRQKRDMLIKNVREVTKRKRQRYFQSEKKKRMAKKKKMTKK